jgi:hypothetical protein
MSSYVAYQQIQILIKPLEFLIRQVSSTNDLDQFNLIELISRLKNGTSGHYKI